MTDPNRGKALNREKRYEIIVGTAEGLAYLHENSKIKIIHRDIKTVTSCWTQNFMLKLLILG